MGPYKFVLPIFAFLVIYNNKIVNCERNCRLNGKEYPGHDLQIIENFAGNLDVCEIRCDEKPKCTNFMLSSWKACFLKDRTGNLSELRDAKTGLKYCGKFPVHRR